MNLIKIDAAVRSYHSKVKAIIYSCCELIQSLQKPLSSMNGHWLISFKAIYD